MFNFFSKLFKSRKDSYSSASNINDAEVLYLGKSDRKTQKKVIEALNKQDLDTRVVYEEDIEFTDEDILIEGANVSDFESEKKVIWRPNTFLDHKKTVDDIIDYANLARSENLDFTSDPLETPIIGDKKKTKEILSSQGVQTPKTYESLEEVNEALSNGQEVVKKNNFGKGGKSFEHFSEPINSFEEDKIYEECLDHFRNESIKDMRMYLVGGRIISLAERKTSNHDFEAKNIDNNGYFTEVNEINYNEINLAENITDIFGEGIYAVDYIKNGEGQVTALELNDTPGTKINNLDYKVDVFDEIAEYIENPEDYTHKDIIAEELKEDLDVSWLRNRFSSLPFYWGQEYHNPVNYTRNNDVLAL